MAEHSFQEDREAQREGENTTGEPHCGVLPKHRRHPCPFHPAASYSSLSHISKAFRGLLFFFFLFRSGQVSQTSHGKSLNQPLPVFVLFSSPTGGPFDLLSFAVILPVRHPGESQPHVTSVAKENRETPCPALVSCPVCAGTTAKGL